MLRSSTEVPNTRGWTPVGPQMLSEGLKCHRSESGPNEAPLGPEM